MFTKILVGYDGSKGGKAALQRAAVLAKHYNAQVTALWVREPLPRHSDLPGDPTGKPRRQTSISANARKRWPKSPRNTVSPSGAKPGADIRPKPS